MSPAFGQDRYLKSPQANKGALQRCLWKLCFLDLSKGMCCCNCWKMLVDLLSCIHQFYVIRTTYASFLFHLEAKGEFPRWIDVFSLDSMPLLVLVFPNRGLAWSYKKRSPKRFNFKSSLQNRFNIWTNSHPADERCQNSCPLQKDCGRCRQRIQKDDVFDSTPKNRNKKKHMFYPWKKSHNQKWRCSIRNGFILKSKSHAQSPNVLNNKTVFHVFNATTGNIVLPGVFGQFMGFQLTRLSFLLDMDPGIVLCLEFQSDTIWG